MTLLGDEKKFYVPVRAAVEDTCIEREEDFPAYHTVGGFNAGAPQADFVSGARLQGGADGGIQTLPSATFNGSKQGPIKLREVIGIFRL